MSSEGGPQMPRGFHFEVEPIDYERGIVKLRDGADIYPFTLRDGEVFPIADMSRISKSKQGAMFTQAGAILKDLPSRSQWQVAQKE